MDSSKAHHESDNLELNQLIDKDGLDINFVIAMAGDREMTGADNAQLECLEAERGEKLYSDLLFAVSHQRFPVEGSKALWYEILAHKMRIASDLRRNPGIFVATIDFILNFKDMIINPVLIARHHLEMVTETAIKDEKTGLFRYSAFISQLRAALRRHEEHHTRVALLMLDIDKFKEYNDTFMHQAGDRALKKIGKIIYSETRDGDFAARYGGEEFSIILENAEPDAVFQFAERLRAKIESQFKGKGDITISIGVSICPEHSTNLQQLVNYADRALYMSKQRGRNCVSVYQMEYAELDECPHVTDHDISSERACAE